MINSRKLSDLHPKVEAMAREMIKNFGMNTKSQYLLQVHIEMQQVRMHCMHKEELKKDQKLPMLAQVKAIITGVWRLILCRY